MRRFFCRCAFVFVTPCLLLLALYVLLDPFKVVRDYDDYFPAEGMYPAVNKGMLSVRNFQRYFHVDSLDSFILGSSMSIPYRVDEWRRYIGRDSRPFHFDSSGESLRSMRLKVEYLLNSGADIENVLIVLPPDIFCYRDHLSVPYINPWQIDPDISWLRYHWTFIKNFYNRKFFRAYVMSRLLGRTDNVDIMGAMSTQPIVMDNPHNEESLPAFESEAICDADSYRAHHHPAFVASVQPTEWVSFATPQGRSEVARIASLLNDNGVRYKVVIGPRLDKRYINHLDLRILADAFGAENVHDFSRSMAYVADDPVNFYDNVHYRPYVAAEIMRRVYAPSKGR